MAVFSCATFRTPGAAAVAQNLFSIWNNGANRIVRARRLVMQMDATAVLTANMPICKTSRVAAAPGGGVTLTKVPWDTSDTASHADIVVKGENSSDGGTRTAIGWICGCGLAYAVLLQPLITGVVRATVPEMQGFVMPSVQTDALMALLFGMLGLGGYRTYEKVVKK